LDYQGKKAAAIAHIKTFLLENYSRAQERHNKLGLKEFKASDNPKEQVLASLFLNLTFANWGVFQGKLTLQ
jgi:hypothetical protein